MARRKAKPKTTGKAPANDAESRDVDSPRAEPSTNNGDGCAPRVLVVDPAPESRRVMLGTLAGQGLDCDAARSLEEARAAFEATRYDAAVAALDLPDGAGFELAAELRVREAPTRVVLQSTEPTLDDALRAMRSGAVDLLGGPFDAAALLASVNSAIEMSRNARRAAERLEKLSTMCRRLTSARDQVTNQVDTLCEELAGAYEELADQVTHMTLASEFKSSIQQELDIEALLRAALEFILAKTGPTNAAVFLPSNHSDFSLGAYVNYDCPKDAADVLLDHLADVIAPRFHDEAGVVVMRDDEQMQEWIGDDANWLAGSGMLVYSCRHDGECLAVVALFRERKSPFPEEFPDQFEIMGDLFAEQLARVVEIHHRHKPVDEWAGWDEWSDDADEEGGFGGLAA